MFSQDLERVVAIEQRAQPARKPRRPWAGRLETFAADYDSHPFV